ncbi:MAG: transposase [Desulfuromonadaceae bacterium]|nr:transposase [Desulfuromonadaceae bacterium]
MDNQILTTHSRSHALRKGRVSLAKNLYLLTSTTHNRQPVFHDLTACRICINALRFQQEQGRAVTLAFVLMPDHLHWLISLEQGTLAQLMQSVKTFTSRQINLQRGGSGSLWQPGYHDRALRKDEDVQSAAGYLVTNPVRAGLVAKVWDYSHWDSVWI